MSDKKNLLVAVVGGLLSSSCCVIQLGLNAASLGCAGFSIFTPYRPLFLGMTGVFLSSVFKKEGFNKNMLTTLLIAASLSFSPEVVKMWNMNSGIFASNKLTHTPIEDEVIVEIEGVACEACSSRVKQALLDTEGVSRDSVICFNENGPTTAQIRVLKTVDTEKLIEAISEAGGSSNPEESAYKAKLIKRENFSGEAMKCEKVELKEEL